MRDFGPSVVPEACVRVFVSQARRRRKAESLDRHCPPACGWQGGPAAGRVLEEHSTRHQGDRACLSGRSGASAVAIRTSLSSQSIQKGVAARSFRTTPAPAFAQGVTSSSFLRPGKDHGFARSYTNPAKQQEGSCSLRREKLKNFRSCIQCRGRPSGRAETVLQAGC